MKGNIKMKIKTLLKTRVAFRLLAFCLLFFALVSCRKQEFMPEPEGQRVPHQEITITLKEALDASPNTLFKAAWSRSNMNSILKSKGSKTPFTILVPSDAAFIADGLTLEVINKTSPALLDSLLLYHTLVGGLEPQALSTSPANAKIQTLLENPYLKVKALDMNRLLDPYFYCHFLKVTDGELMLNGKKAGKGIPVQAINGTLWPIDHVLHKPTKTIMEVLQEDGRFGMYLQIMSITDGLWAEATMGMGDPRDFTIGLTVKEIYSGGPNISFTSIFAPTDEAFHQAGFKNVDDLMTLNSRAPFPYIDWNTYEIVGTGYVTDSLLAMHRWGKLYAPKDSWGKGSPNPDIFYSNDLNNSLLADYALLNSGSSGALEPYKVPLDFGAEKGKVKVGVKGAKYPTATVIESDINTLMGPIHVVDRLLPHKDFKF